MARSLERPNRYFTYLRRLRAEGRSNMYGAIPYLAAAFGIDRNESFRIICEWVDSQEAIVGNSPVPKAAVPAERAAEPTFFDPLPPGDPLAPANARTARKPVKQAAAAKKSRRRPSDSRAA